MRRIGLYLCLSLLMLLLGGCSKFIKPCVEINVNVLSKLPAESFQEKGAYYSVKIDMTNKTDSEFCFWIMSCGWEDFFTSNNAIVQMYAPYNCDKTIALLKRIKTHESISFNGVMRIEDPSKLREKDEIRFGLLYFKKEEYDRSIPDYRFFTKGREVKEIVWSKPFQIRQDIPIAPSPTGYEAIE